jgi:hypothetical protein
MYWVSWDKGCTLYRSKHFVTGMQEFLFFVRGMAAVLVNV